MTQHLPVCSLYTTTTTTTSPPVMLRLQRLFAAVAFSAASMSGCGAGDVGLAGAPGPAGATGAAGTPGLTGADGLLGATGAAGTPGATGTPGVAGTPGATGTPGAAGTPGAPGAPGAAGAVGAPGAPAVAAGIGTLTLNNAAISAMPQANAAAAQTTLDGADTVLRLFTPATAANPVGTFVGGGFGNKAIVGLSGFNGMKLTDLGGLEFDVRVLQGPPNNFYMNFIIDLDCTADEIPSALTIADIRLRRRVLIWNPDVASGYAVGGGYTRYAGSFTSNQWNLVGAPNLGIPANGSPSGPITPLTGYPFACVLDGVSADGGLLRDSACTSAVGLPGTASASCGSPTSGALLLMGDSINLTQREIYVKRLRVRDRVVSFN